MKPRTIRLMGDRCETSDFLDVLGEEEPSPITVCAILSIGSTGDTGQ
jgi:hypothetical protein